MSLIEYIVGNMSKHANQTLVALQESLNTKTEKLSGLSQKCLSAKHSLWEAEAQKRFLLHKLEETKSPRASEHFISELKSKYDRCKGTCIEKVLSSLIKAYEQHIKQSNSLSSYNLLKENLLNTYQQTTQSLSQESSLKQQLMDLQNSLLKKEKKTDDFKAKLESLRLNYNKLKEHLDTGEVKDLLEQRIQLGNELKKCLEDQSILNIEIEKTEQLIETEKNVNNVTPDVANKVLKLKIKEIENQVADIVQKVRGREKVRDRVKVQVEKIAGRAKTMNKSLCLDSSRQKIGTPVSRDGGKKFLAFTPSCKAFSRDLGMSREKSESKGLLESKGFGSVSQSFASKIVLMNRAQFFK